MNDIMALDQRQPRYRSVLSELLSSPRAVPLLSYQTPSSTFAKLGGAGSGRKCQHEQRFIVLLSTKHGRTRASHGVQGFTFGTDSDA